MRAEFDEYGRRILPTREIVMQMTNNKAFHVRHAYTMFDVLGDVGGFNGAVLSILSLFMGSYSSSVYFSQVSSEIPTLKVTKPGR